MAEMNVGEARSILQSLWELMKRTNNLDAQQQILQVREALQDLQDRYLALREENRRLSEQLELRDSMVYDEPVYYQRDGNETGGPYCQRCFDAEGLAIRLQRSRKRIANNGFTPIWICRKCESSYARSGNSS